MLPRRTRRSRRISGTIVRGDFSDSLALIRAREEKVVDRCKLGELDDQEEYRIPL